MKPEAVIVNMGRGGIVDEAALATAVDSGQIAGAAMDVSSCEPLPEDNPLSRVTRKDRLSLTPHTAWASDDALQSLVQAICQNIKNFYKI